MGAPFIESALRRIEQGLWCLTQQKYTQQMVQDDRNQKNSDDTDKDWQKIIEVASPSLAGLASAVAAVSKERIRYMLYRRDIDESLG